MNGEQSDLRTRLDRLQDQLASRDSVEHFAHAAVTTVAALIVSGIAGKLAWDSEKTLKYALGLAAVSLAMLLYASVRYTLGRLRLRTELVRYEELKQVRRALRADDPAALLPQ